MVYVCENCDRVFEEEDIFYQCLDCLNDGNNFIFCPNCSTSHVHASFKDYTLVNGNPVNISPGVTFRGKK